MNSGILEKLRPGFGQNLLNYYDYARKNDLYLSFAVTPASGRKSADLFPGQQRDDPNLQVVAEDNEGVTVSGMKMMATSAVYADEILIGNLTPIEDKYKSEAITAAMPLNAPGVSLWSRQPYALAAQARGRLSAVVPFRRDRQRAGVRPRQDSVAARVPAQRRQHVAAHLHRDAGELLPEPPVEHPVLVEDGADRRRREPRLPGQRHRQDSGGARGARPHGGAGRRRSAGWCRARSRRGRIGPKATPRRTAASCMARSTGARSTTPRSSTRCARCSAPIRW